ncbi:MAG: Cof-type HAD-IIB family hydrolase [Planctomycetota bacterium]
METTAENGSGLLELPAELADSETAADEALRMLEALERSSAEDEADGDETTLEAEAEGAPATAKGPPVPAYDLIAVDLDGTLIRSDRRLNKRDVRAIQQATAAGVKVVLCTARPPRTVREVYRMLGLGTLMVNYNGAMIRQPATGENLLHLPLDGELVREVVEVAREDEPDLLVNLEVQDKWYTDRFDPQLTTATAATHPPDVVGPLDEVYGQPVTKLMLLAEPERLGPVRAKVARQFRNRVTVVMSDEHMAQIVHPAVDKGFALAWVAGCYGVTPDRVMAIGDAPNDAGMLRWAGLGVAVDNAWREAMDAADVVVPSNDESGVAAAIRRYALGEA